MYWEEVTELIKTHTDDVESKYPNQLNDDDYITYEYERGTVKTSYIHIDEFPEKIKDVLKKYLKYGLQTFKYSLHLVHQKVLVYITTQIMF